MGDPKLNLSHMSISNKCVKVNMIGTEILGGNSLL